jgi:SepF-like predicted cell division protein (DUF552 family)
MVLEKLFGRGFKKIDEKEFIEMDTSGIEVPAGKIPIKVDKLEDFSDTERIQKTIRNGSIVLVKITALKSKDITELKRAIEKLRSTCIAMNGDIAGIDEEWIVICPSYAHVARSA